MTPFVKDQRETPCRPLLLPPPAKKPEVRHRAPRACAVPHRLRLGAQARCRDLRGRLPDLRGRTPAAGESIRNAETVRTELTCARVASRIKVKEAVFCPWRSVQTRDLTLQAGEFSKCVHPLHKMLLHKSSCRAALHSITVVSGALSCGLCLKFEKPAYGKLRRNRKPSKRSPASAWPRPRWHTNGSPLICRCSALCVDMQCFHLLKSIVYFPLLVMKSIYADWTYFLFFPGGLSKWKSSVDWI